MSEHKQLRQIGEVRATYNKERKHYEVETKRGQIGKLVKGCFEDWYFVVYGKAFDAGELNAVGVWLKELAG